MPDLRSRTKRLATLLLGSLLAMTGCEGAAGPAGANGANGQDGQDGQSGLDGQDGLDGTNGQDGQDGIDGTNGQDGQNGTDGQDGTDGQPGLNGGNVEVGNFHGSERLLADALANDGKYFVTATITGAAADAAGTVTVDFTVANADGDPVTGIPKISANIAKLVPAGNGESFNKWVPYIYGSQTVSNSANGDWPNPDGTAADQGSREGNGTLTDHGDGSYTYVYSTNLSNIVTPVGATPIAYEQGLTHRVSIMMGGHSGATADAVFDFVPDGSAVTETRDIVRTDACKSCHGDEFHGHGGDRLTVETCVTCHNPSTTDPHGGESVDLKVMIHKIHSGGELASIPGPDGIVWDNPATPADESADNGSYAIWGYQNAKIEWWKVGFPAVIENCTKCHQGQGADVDNWKTTPSRAACGSCHDDVDFVTGTNHPGGPQANDNNCSTCHQPSGGGLAPITEAHDWSTKDVRNIPEFTVDMTVSTPANGTHFVAGEAPVVTVVIKENGQPIDHTTISADPSAEGCVTNPCPARDGLFAASSFFVHGPRADRVPVLTTKARVRITSAGAGPFDISAAGATLDLKLDGGKEIYSEAQGGKIFPGNVSVPVSSGTFASTAAATPAEIMAWLNGNAAFAARARAYLEPGGQVSIKSKNLGDFYSLQLGAGAVTSAVFAGDTTVKVIGGSTVSNSIAKQANPANNDPKVQWFTDHLTYSLDPVDDLRPGTYVASVELSDRGRKSATDYKTPSVARITFQVGTATEELAPAGNCAACHQGPDGKGFVLDYSRHNKIFNDTAVDQCGACHDYQSQTATGPWGGARPIAKRVHAVHFGSSLNYPLVTVDYSGGDPVPGRNWDITFPQDVRNCETCHPANTSSGTWETKAARIPCSGCHDSDAARSHIKLQTYDPTPADPWNGDEEESCQVCH